MSGTDGDGPPNLPATQSKVSRPWDNIDVDPIEAIERSTDGMVAIRKLLTEIAKIIAVFAVIFLAIVLMIVSYEFMLFAMEVL